MVSVLAFRAGAYKASSPECPVTTISQPQSEPERERVDDAVLVRQIAAGDQQALATLYDRHASRVLGVALSILRNRSDAEDLVHDVFIEVWQDADRFRPELSSLGAWLITRVRFRAIDRIRKLEVARRHLLKERASAIPEQEVGAEGPMPDPLVAECKRRIENLPEPQRAVLHLMYFRGLTCQEIAERMNAPLGTIKSRLSQALKRLRDGVGEHLDVETMT